MSSDSVPSALKQAAVPVLGVDHLGWALRSISAAAPFFTGLGYSLGPVMRDELRHVEVCLAVFDNNTMNNQKNLRGGGGYA
ncbi:MAG: hypothetical protein IJ228_08630 [Succinivibrio sp.]|nr:hypothetical protein [Succinivibrio sp.]